MTGITSQDNLRGQQQRIMKALRATQENTQPRPEELLNALTAQSSGRGNYFEMMGGYRDKAQKESLAAEQDLYTMMKEQAAQGNAEAAAIDKAISDITGNDPAIYTQIAGELHADPENVTSSNARAKVMRIAAQKGIVPLDIQKDKLGLKKTQADINKIYSDMGKPSKEESEMLGKRGAQERVTGQLNTLADLYKSLDKAKAIPSTKRSLQENVGAYIASTTPGQILGRMGGTTEQTTRDEINQIKPLLIQEIRQASAMGAKGMDSEKELRFYLQAATDPTRSIESNMAALEVLDKAYGLGANIKAPEEAREELKKQLPKDPFTPEQIKAELERRKKLGQL